MKLIAIALTSCFLSTVALAHGDVLEMTTLSITEGLKQLKKDHPEHVDHFQGVKAWPVEKDIKLKIYLPDNATLGYTCVHKDAGTDASKVICTMEM